MEIHQVSRFCELLPEGVDHEERGVRHCVKGARRENGDHSRVCSSRVWAWCLGGGSTRASGQFDEALAFQISERGPHGGAAYLEMLAKFTLGGQALRPMPGLKVRAQRFRRLIDERIALRDCCKRRI